MIELNASLKDKLSCRKQWPFKVSEAAEVPGVKFHLCMEGSKSGFRWQFYADHS